MLSAVLADVGQQHCHGAEGADEDAVNGEGVMETSGVRLEEFEEENGDELEEGEYVPMMLV